MSRRNRMRRWLLGSLIAASLTLGVIWGSQPVNTAGFAWGSKAQAGFAWGTNAHANITQADQVQASFAWGSRS
jgi:hypothetical protein